MCMICTVGSKLKSWWSRMEGGRTVILNGAIAAVILLTEMVSWLAGFGGWGSIFSATTAMWITLAVNILNIVLRFVTTTPAFEQWRKEHAPSSTPMPPTIPMGG